MKGKKLILIVIIVAVIAIAGAIVAIKIQSGASAEILGYASKAFNSIEKHGAIIHVCYEKYDSLSDSCVYFVSDDKTKLPDKGYIFWFYRIGYGEQFRYDGKVAIAVVDQSGEVAFVYDDYNYEKAFNATYSELQAQSPNKYLTPQETQQYYKMASDMCAITHPLHEKVTGRSSVLLDKINPADYYFTETEINKITGKK